MNQRDELAHTATEAFYVSRASLHAMTSVLRLAWFRVADAILAAGYTKPRTITTVEELDALPVGAVVLSGGAIPRIKAEEGYWLGDGIDVDGSHILRYARFATVIHEPNA